MPSVTYTVLLALHAAAFIGLTSTAVTTIQAVASPLPMPLPLLVADYSHHDLIATRAPPRRRKSMAKSIKNKHNETGIVHRPQQSPTIATADPLRPRKTDDLLDSLVIYYNKSHDYADSLNGLASRSATIKSDDYNFRQSCASALTGYYTNLFGFQGVFAQLGADKGLANYDRKNDLETLLKDFVNLNKDTLCAINILLDNFPILGPILGPIVYEIKCLLDNVLNTVENLTDAIINAIQPLLQLNCSEAVLLTCKSGVQILGLCI